MISKAQKSKVMQEFAAHERDTGSSKVQIAVLTRRINELTEHLREHRKDHAARRGLLKMVGARSGLLKYLNSNDFLAYRDTITRLGLRK